MSRLIKFRAWDGERFWYEGEMNGFAYYRCSMEKMGDNWHFTRCNKTVASSTKGHRLEHAIGTLSKWEVS